MLIPVKNMKVLSILYQFLLILYNYNYLIQLLNVISEHSDITINISLNPIIKQSG